MTADLDLLCDARSVARKMKADERDELFRLIHEYETACDLSRGPDPDRAVHWQIVAAGLMKRLERITRL